MTRLKDVVQEDIQSAIEDYHDEIKLHKELYGDNYTIEDATGLTVKAGVRARARLVSKLFANGLSEDEVEKIVDENA
tara:strand:+ start:541 stop:771 length:231 start_codon:yes stop_codon:yes gene_type:complete